MDLSKGSATQINDYISSWINNAFVYNVNIKDSQKCTEWCEDYLEHWEWAKIEYINKNQHRFVFQNKEDVEEFKEVMGI